MHSSGQQVPLLVLSPYNSDKGQKEIKRFKNIPKVTRVTKEGTALKSSSSSLVIIISCKSSETTLPSLLLHTAPPKVSSRRKNSGFITTFCFAILEIYLKATESSVCPQHCMLYMRISKMAREFTTRFLIFSLVGSFSITCPSKLIVYFHHIPS